MIIDFSSNFKIKYNLRTAIFIVNLVWIYNLFLSFSFSFFSFRHRKIRVRTYLSETLNLFIKLICFKDKNCAASGVINNNSVSFSLCFSVSRCLPLPLYFFVVLTFLFFHCLSNYDFIRNDFGAIVF